MMVMAMSAIQGNVTDCAVVLSVKKNNDNTVMIPLQPRKDKYST
jgi:hypothetical protein